MPITHTLKENVNVTGELMGQRMYIASGIVASSGSARYLQDAGGTTYTIGNDGIGVPMHRAGSIVGISVSLGALVVVDGSFDIEVRKGSGAGADTTIFTVNTGSTASGATNFYITETYARGTYPVAVDELIKTYTKVASGTLSSRNIVVVLEIVLDT